MAAALAALAAAAAKLGRNKPDVVWLVCGCWSGIKREVSDLSQMFPREVKEIEGIQNS